MIGRCGQWRRCGRVWQRTVAAGREVVSLKGVESITTDGITRPQISSYLTALYRRHTSDKAWSATPPLHTGLASAFSHGTFCKTLVESGPANERRSAPGGLQSEAVGHTAPASVESLGNLYLRHDKNRRGVIYQQGSSWLGWPDSLFQKTNKFYPYRRKTFLDTSATDYGTRAASFCSERPPVVTGAAAADDRSDVDMKKAFQIVVKTGDQEGAGTDANVHVILEDEYGVTTPRLKLDKILYNDLERSKRDTYTIECPNDFGKVSRLRLSRDTVGIADDWFCDYIHVEDRRKPPMKKIAKTQTAKSIRNFLGSNYLKENVAEQKGVYFFPIHRWVAPQHDYLFDEYATCLPQHDPCLEPRKSDLMKKRSSYTYIVRAEGLVAQIENLPSDEKFSEEYYWTFATEKMNLLTQTKFIEWTTSKWNTLEDLKKVYKQGLGEPECMEVWKEDWWFGLQRLQGVNPNVISLCKEIPENFDVTEDTVKGLLDMSLAEALEKNKIFICDLKIMDNLECKDDRELASPLALFYLNKEDRLLPIAIQLKQKSGHDNPVYTPNDAPNTWLVAKMFYNNAEAQHHQALTHLGYTHLLMEGVVICTNRNLSPSHPLFKLMAPHFLFLLAINTRGLEKLVSVGGWVDNCMTQGVKGIFELMRRGFECWRFDREGQIEKELEARGVLDENVLPYYPYRDDGVPLYNAIKKYVTTVVSHHYDTPEKLSGDWELRWWREELVKPRNQSGVGLQNIPGNSEDGFTDVSQVIDVVTVIIATCSLGHAAANFQQYEQYGFVPNYPGILISNVPKEKKLYTEKDIMTILPDKRMTLDIMVITKLLSSKGTNSLGDFEMQYLYDPVGVQAAEEFQKDLKRLSLDMKRRNIDRQWKFEWLDPEIVPNSISV
ncbi:polyunsaturated fatty acid 5-lipoxygenase-like isoform X2 [Panulirus ornatus]|uniref:polyunsaturated fatty acid 5-lipoxygenase-like isoform X2 n=1 Tax=Panulirus ornatus TaxID=150431 RepID=UPI003A86AB91